MSIQTIQKKKLLSFNDNETEVKSLIAFSEHNGERIEDRCQSMKSKRFFDKIAHFEKDPKRYKNMIEQYYPDNEDDSEDEKSCYERAFGYVKKDSLRGMVFVLVTTSFGLGVLTLPYVNKQNGLVLGTCFLIVGAIISYTSMRLLMWCSHYTNIVDYAELVEYCFGKVFQIRCQQSIKVCWCILKLLVYYLLIWSVSFVLNDQYYVVLFLIHFSLVIKFVSTIVTQDFAIKNDFFTSYQEKIIQIIILNLLLLPIALYRDLGSLRYFSFFGFFSVIYTVILVMVQAPQYHKQNVDGQEFRYVNFTLATVQGFSMAIFAYTCHTSIFMARTELSNPTTKRIKKVFWRATYYEFAIYLIIALVGYWSLGEKTTKILIDRDPLPGSNDILMTIARIGFTINISFCIPLNLFPERRQICLFLKIKQPTPKTSHFAITFILLAGSAFVAYLFPYVVNTVSILGGLCSVAVVITFPGLMFWKLSNLRYSDPGLLMIVFFTIFLTLAGWASAVVSILDYMGTINLDKLS